MKKIVYLMDWGIFGLRSYWYIVYLLQMIRTEESDISFMLTLLWFLAAWFIPYLFWVPQRKAKEEWFCLTEGVLGGIYSVYLVVLTGETTNFFLIPLLSIGYLISRKIAWLAPVLLLLPYLGSLFQAITFKQASGSVADGLLFFGIGLWVNVIAQAYRRNSQLMKEIETQNKLLTQYAEQIEKITLLEERNRMSKELHDTLGHSYISFILGLDAALALLDKHPHIAKKKLQRLRDLTEQNIDQMRNVVHQMDADEEADLTEQVSHLIESFREYTGTDIQFMQSGSEQGVSNQVRQTVVRMIQEAFTNAVKHGKATQIECKMEYTEHSLRVYIADNGVGIKDITFGFGLTSMKQRIDNLNGQLHVRPSSASGIELFCDIPLKGESYA